MLEVAMPHILPNDPIAKAALTSGAALLGAYALYKGGKRYFTQSFVHAGNVEKIFIYPVKSLRGLELKHAIASEKGIRYGELQDREFMIIDENNRFISQRQQPRLGGIKVIYDIDNSPQKFVLKADGLPDLSISLTPIEEYDESDLIDCRLWRANYYTIEVNPEASAWFSQYLNLPNLKFVRIIKPVDPTSPFSPHLHDRTSYHIFGTASIQDLQQRIKEQYEKEPNLIPDISYRNFRPSILVKTNIPYIEDYWKQIAIGCAKIVFYERCDRCILTTVNPDTLVKTNIEPLKTLRKYRVDRSEYGRKIYCLAPLFGTKNNLLPGCDGYIEVGDSVAAQFSKEPLL